METNIARVERLFEAYDNMVTRAINLAINHHKSWNADQYEAINNQIKYLRGKRDATAIILEMMRGKI